MIHHWWSWLMISHHCSVTLPLFHVAFVLAARFLDFSLVHQTDFCGSEHLWTNSTHSPAESNPLPVSARHCATFFSITNLSAAFAEDVTFKVIVVDRMAPACDKCLTVAAGMLFLCLFLKAVTCHCGQIYSPARAKTLNCVLLMGFLIQLRFHYPRLGNKVILSILMMLTEIKAWSERQNCVGWWGQQTGAELIGCDGRVTAVNADESDLFTLSIIWNSWQ